MIWKILFLPVILLQMTTTTLTNVLCELGAPSSRPGIFHHKLLNWKSYSFQRYSCHASSCKKCDFETKTEGKLTDHVVKHRIQESPDDNGKTSTNITSNLKEHASVCYEACIVVFFIVYKFYLREVIKFKNWNFSEGGGGGGKHQNPKVLIYKLTN